MFAPSTTSFQTLKSSKPVSAENPTLPPSSSSTASKRNRKTATTWAEAPRSTRTVWSATATLNSSHGVSRSNLIWCDSNKHVSLKIHLSGDKQSDKVPYQKITKRLFAKASARRILEVIASLASHRYLKNHENWRKETENQLQNRTRVVRHRRAEQSQMQNIFQFSWLFCTKFRLFDQQTLESHGNAPEDIGSTLRLLQLPSNHNQSHPTTKTYRHNSTLLLKYFKISLCSCILTHLYSIFRVCVSSSRVLPHQSKHIPADAMCTLFGKPTSSSRRRPLSSWIARSLFTFSTLTFTRPSFRWSDHHGKLPSFPYHLLITSFQGDAVADALEQLSADQIEQFRKYFNMFDKEGKGYIRATQVGQILRTMGQAFEERDLKQLIKEFDADGSGEIEFEEFAAMVANFVVNNENDEGLEEELREAFRLYDKEVFTICHLGRGVNRRNCLMTGYCRMS